MEEQIRQTAIDRFQKGESPKQIYSSLNRSKKWFFKWLKRYRSGEEFWFKDRCRAPKKSPQRISEIDRQRIIAARKHLEAEPFAQIGTSAIK
jgi:putative transposase